ncbi:hypothetical protein OYT88_14810 [Sporolactobacillus sp. CQH2019]|uniref:hypothetical protein n=1 Tax=Sporolactobacillus sp. CQH2019 TaxID=3023512 RepID=UPI0023683A27|nr:hypothetical protein [Sporolactobacillus sp. CQH2019]MDD9149823.1 hypothetical protein [Sporolactobacillus sp. CQH2019]
MKTNQRSEENRAIPSIELEELKKSFERDKPESLLNHIHMSPESRKLVENNSFALLIAIVADQSVKMEVAWNLPYELGKRIGMERLHPQWITRNSEKVKDAIAQKPALHRFPQKMTDYIFSLSTIIENKYSSAAGLLRSSMDYHVFVANVKEVSGISDKKANFLFLTLSLDFHYSFKNTEESSVLFDTHMEKWLSQHFNRTISKKEANEICAYVSPGNPALFCPYVWNKDHEIK